MDYTTGTNPRSVSLGDLDGDGKADLAVANLDDVSVSVFRNTSTSGTIDASSFADKEDYTTGSFPNSVSIGDLDGDGKADLAVANFNSNTVSVLRNNIIPTITSFTPTSGPISASVTITGTNFGYPSKQYRLLWRYTSHRISGNKY